MWVQRHHETVQQMLRHGYVSVEFDKDLADEVAERSRRLLDVFDLPAHRLAPLHHDRLEQRRLGNAGWFPPGQETAMTESVADPKQMFHIPARNCCDSHPGWGADFVVPPVPDAERHAERLHEIGLAVGMHVIRAAHRARPHPQGREPTEALAAGNHTLRLIAYDTGTAAPPEWLAAPHTGVNVLSVALYSSAPGLQVERDGEWARVGSATTQTHAVAMLGELATDLGFTSLPATPHGVRALRRRRQAVVWFMHPPPPAIMVDGRTYETTLNDRLRAIATPRDEDA